MTESRPSAEQQGSGGLARRLKSGAHGILRALFLAFDSLYRKWHRLQAIDDFLLIEIRRWRGARQSCDDGTQVAPGDTVAILHFNNGYLRQIHERAARGGHPPSLAFGIHLIRSLQGLATRFADDPALAEVSAITAVTWFKPHGGSIGFHAEPLPPGFRTTLLRLHFRILLAALFPGLARRENRRLQPHRFWLTRRQLFKMLDEEDNHVVQRLTGRNPARAAL